MILPTILLLAWYTSSMSRKHPTDVPGFNYMTLCRVIPPIKALVEVVNLRYRTTYETEIWHFRVVVRDLELTFIFLRVGTQFNRE